MKSELISRLQVTFDQIKALLKSKFYFYTISDATSDPKICKPVEPGIRKRHICRFVNIHISILNYLDCNEFHKRDLQASN